MNERTRQKIEELLSDPMLLRMKKPFTRGTTSRRGFSFNQFSKNVDLNESIEAVLPTIRRNVISQDTFVEELDPASHKVLFDENIPKISAKINKDQYAELEYSRMAVPYQKLIRDKQVLHLCGNPTQFTLMNTNPSEKENKDFATFKQYWNLRNMDGMRTKAVSAQKSFGDVGLLFYLDYKGQIKARLLSYNEGYVLCPHNDDNGDRILESVYYHNDEGEFIDSYDDEYMYRYVYLYDEDSQDGGRWVMRPKVKHGFSEIPIVTKRGDVPWSCVQNIIEVYEIIYNIFLVIQKRHGWGILYVKGNFKDKAKKIAGAVVLNDTSLDGKGSADFKQAPSPQNMIETLNLMDETIQKSAGVTIILPKDIKSAGDISAQAIMLTQSRDIETALQGSIEWQNFISKCERLFKEGLAKELVNKGENPTAITDFENLKINASMKVWRPHNDTEYNNMIIALKQSGCISEETSIEVNTISAPDEKMRRQKEREEEERKEEDKFNREQKAKETEVKEAKAAISDKGLL